MSSDEKPARRVVIATAGHVDYGKTSLILALTGTDTDRLPDEKRRGIIPVVAEWLRCPRKAHDLPDARVDGTPLAGCAGL